MKAHKVILIILSLVFVMMTGVFSMTFLSTFRDFRHLKEKERMQSQRLVEVHNQLANQERYIQLLLSDEDFFEQVVRKKLGYVRPGETIFLFDE